MYIKQWTWSLPSSWYSELMSLYPSPCWCLLNGWYYLGVLARIWAPVWNEAYSTFSLTLLPYLWASGPYYFYPKGSLCFDSKTFPVFSQLQGFQSGLPNLVDVTIARSTTFMASTTWLRSFFSWTPWILWPVLMIIAFPPRFPWLSVPSC